MQCLQLRVVGEEDSGKEVRRIVNRSNDSSLGMMRMGKRRWRMKVLG
jgi:hypothetical protein